MKILRIFAAWLLLCGPVLAQAQVGSGQVWGNSGASRAPGKSEAISAIFDRALGSTRGGIIERGASGWAIVGPSATTGLAWISQGAGADPTYGVVGLAGGGCAAALTASNGGILYSTASACAVLPGTATARQMLQSGPASTPAWSTATWPATTTINRILYSSAASVVGEIATANNGILGTSAGGIPSVATLGGDCSFSTPNITCVKVNGVSFGASPSTDTVPVITAANTATYTALPNCTTGVLQYATATHLFSCGAAGAGTVTSVAIGGGLAGSTPITTTGTISLRQSTAQVFNSGTAATYTSAAASKYIAAQFCGGGGGGSGSGTGATMGNGGGGGGTIFDTVTAGGGAAGTSSGGGSPGAGGTITGSPDISWVGANGASVITVTAGGLSSGVPGGASPLWGGANINGVPTPNSGAGGASGLFNGAGNTGAGGGSGACAEVYRAGGGATYTYTIGASGTAGTAGTSGAVGFAGAAGRLIVREY